jgi:SulP family sulfate permease
LASTAYACIEAALSLIRWPEWTGNIRGDMSGGPRRGPGADPRGHRLLDHRRRRPKVGLYASFSIAVITAIAGGRPGMISAATAATAVLMVTLVKEHGLQYLLAATVLAGLIQIAPALSGSAM